MTKRYAFSASLDPENWPGALFDTREEAVAELTAQGEPGDAFYTARACYPSVQEVVKGLFDRMDLMYLLEEHIAEGEWQYEDRGEPYVQLPKGSDRRIDDRMESELVRELEAIGWRPNWFIAHEVEEHYIPMEGEDVRGADS